MRNNKPVPFITLLLSGALVLGACSPASLEPEQSAAVTSDAAAIAEPAEEAGVPARSQATEDGPQPADGRSLDILQLPAVEQSMLTNYSKGLKAVEGVWPGYDPTKIPKIVSIVDTSNVMVSFALDHDGASELGTATPVDTKALGLANVYRITDHADVELFEALAPYYMNAELGGQPTFTVIGRTDAGLKETGSDGFGAETPQFTVFLLHELFHRYQIDEFKRDSGKQDVDGYDYSKENIALAILEDKILLQLDKTAGAEARRSLARQLVAVRSTRLERDGRVKLDFDQESLEGTARYIEHRIGDAMGTIYNSSNYASELRAHEHPEGGRMSVAFGRFYSTGAATMNLLDEFGPADAKQQITAGQSPMEVLIATLRVDAADRAALIDAARSLVDPGGSIDGLADKAAEVALSEESNFSKDLPESGPVPESELLDPDEVPNEPVDG